MATDLTRFSRYRARHFDRNADFVVLRPLIVGGVSLRPGDRFDANTVTVRTHRLLFEQRKIDVVGGVWHQRSTATQQQSAEPSAERPRRGRPPKNKAA